MCARGVLERPHVCPQVVQCRKMSRSGILRPLRAERDSRLLRFCPTGSHVCAARSRLVTGIDPLIAPDDRDERPTGRGGAVRRMDANNSRACGSTVVHRYGPGYPQGAACRARNLRPPVSGCPVRAGEKALVGPIGRIDPVAAQRVPLAGLTGVDRCRMPMTVRTRMGERCQLTCNWRSSRPTRPGDRNC